MLSHVELETVNCPVCNHNRARDWLVDTRPTRYVRCQDCGTVYSSPRYTQNRRHALTREAWGVTPGMFQIEAKRRQALQLEAELIQQHVQNGAMLDVGCSAGHFFEFFPLAQWQRYGVEMSEATAQFASQTYSAQVKPGTLLSAQFPDNNFDLVSFIDMFYYVDDPVAELSEARRILKPQGSLAIEISGQAYTFARSRGVIAWLLDKSWCRLHSDSHLYWFNPWGLNSLLAKAGFTPYAWYVSPSPHHGTFIVDALSTAHYHVSRIFSKLSFKTLNWAPKYLCLAHPV